MAATARAGLVNQSIQADILYPNTSTLFQALGTAIVNPTATFTSSTNIRYVVSDTQIDITNLSGGTLLLLSASFSGIRFSEVGTSPSTILGVAINSATNVGGFSLANVTFDATHLFVNLSGLTLPTTADIRLDITSTPEPATSSFVGLGLSIAAAVRLFRK